MGRESSAHCLITLGNAKSFARGFDRSVDGAVRDVEDLVVIEESLDIVDDEAHGLIIDENVAVFVALASAYEERSGVRIEVGDEEAGEFGASHP